MVSDEVFEKYYRFGVHTWSWWIKAGSPGPMKKVSVKVMYSRGATLTDELREEISNLVAPCPVEFVEEEEELYDMLGS